MGRRHRIRALPQHSRLAGVQPPADRPVGRGHERERDGGLHSAAGTAAARCVAAAAPARCLGRGPSSSFTSATAHCRQGRAAEDSASPETTRGITTWGSASNPSRSLVSALGNRASPSRGPAWSGQASTPTERGAGRRLRAPCSRHHVAATFRPRHRPGRSLRPRCWSPLSNIPPTGVLADRRRRAFTVPPPRSRGGDDEPRGACWTQRSAHRCAATRAVARRVVGERWTRWGRRFAPGGETAGRGQDQAPAARAGAEADRPGHRSQEHRENHHTLANFGTRHTESSQTDPNVGIGAATNVGLQHPPGLRGGVRRTNDRGAADLPSAGRSPTPSSLPAAWTSPTWSATIKGSLTPDRIYVVSGHIDSRRTVLTNPDRAAGRGATTTPRAWR